MSTRDRDRRRHTERPKLYVASVNVEPELNPVVKRNRAIIKATLGSNLGHVMEAVLSKADNYRLRPEKDMEEFLRGIVEAGVELKDPNNDSTIELNFGVFSRIVRGEALDYPDYWKREIAKFRETAKSEGEVI